MSIEKEAKGGIDLEPGFFQDGKNTLLAGSLGLGAIGGLGSAFLSSRNKDDTETKEQRRSRILRQGLLGAGLGATVGSAPGILQMLSESQETRPEGGSDPLEFLGMQGGSDTISEIGNSWGGIKNITGMNMNPLDPENFGSGTGQSQGANIMSLLGAGGMALKDRGSDWFKKYKAKALTRPANNFLTNTLSGTINDDLINKIKKQVGSNVKLPGFNPKKFSESLKQGPRSVLDSIKQMKRDYETNHSAGTRLGPIQAPSKFYDALVKRITDSQPAGGDAQKSLYAALRRVGLSSKDIKELHSGSSGQAPPSTVLQRLKNMGIRDPLGGGSTLSTAARLGQGARRLWNPLLAFGGTQAAGALINNREGGENRYGKLKVLAYIKELQERNSGNNVSTIQNFLVNNADQLGISANEVGDVERLKALYNSSELGGGKEFNEGSIEGLRSILNQKFLDSKMRN